jgi:hypothetical protein
MATDGWHDHSRHNDCLTALGRALAAYAPLTWLARAIYRRSKLTHRRWPCQIERQLQILATHARGFGEVRHLFPAIELTTSRKLLIGRYEQHFTSDRREAPCAAGNHETILFQPVNNLAAGTIGPFPSTTTRRRSCNSEVVRKERQMVTFADH